MGKDSGIIASRKCPVGFLVPVRIIEHQSKHTKHTSPEKRFPSAVGTTDIVTLEFIPGILKTKLKKLFQINEVFTKTGAELSTRNIRAPE